MDWQPKRSGPLSELPALTPGEPFLPLSWRIESGLAHPRLQHVALPGQSAEWLALGSVPTTWSPRQLAQWICQTQGLRPFVMRGCHPALLSWLQPAGGQMLLTGREALLDLRGGHLARGSLRQLARRGRRHGEVQHWTHPEQPPFAPRLEPFLTRVRSHYSAPLTYLYRSQLSESERFFALTDRDERILGLISLVPNGPQSWHTELMARDPEAPVGIMEALIESIFATLAGEGALYWSLGEVPFYPTQPPQDLKTLALTGFGRRLDAAYSARGLYRFKAKFNPIWRPVCLYGWPHLSWLTLAGLFWRCNGHKLVAVGAKMVGRR